MDAFTSHLCQGILHPHYDPFNSINLHKAVDYEFAAYVNMTQRVRRPYYSYSPNVPDTLFGIRCNRPLPEGGFFQFSVDKSNPQIYALRMRYGISMNPFRNLDQRFPDSPFLLRGLWLFGEDLVTDLDFCIEVDPIEYTSSATELRESTVEISIDDRLLPSAHVDENGYLRMDDSAVNNVDEHFTYCYDTRQLEPGRRILTLTVTTTHGSTHEYAIPIVTE